MAAVRKAKHTRKKQTSTAYGVLKLIARKPPRRVPVEEPADEVPLSALTPEEALRLAEVRARADVEEIGRAARLKQLGLAADAPAAAERRAAADSVFSLVGQAVAAGEPHECWARLRVLTDAMDELGAPSPRREALYRHVHALAAPRLVAIVAKHHETTLDEWSIEHSRDPAAAHARGRELLRRELGGSVSDCCDEVLLELESELEVLRREVRRLHTALHKLGVTSDEMAVPPNWCAQWHRRAKPPPLLVQKAALRVQLDKLRRAPVDATHETPLLKSKSARGLPALPRIVPLDGGGGKKNKNVPPPLGHARRRTARASAAAKRKPAPLPPLEQTPDDP